jgi:hypothetical protein
MRTVQPVRKGGWLSKGSTGRRINPWLRKPRQRDMWKQGMVYRCACRTVCPDGLSFRVHVQERHKSYDYERFMSAWQTPKGWLRILTKAKPEKKAEIMDVIERLGVLPLVEAEAIK